MVLTRYIAGACAASSLVFHVSSAFGGDPRPFSAGEKVVFLGDSITHGGKYVTYLQMRLAEMFPEDPPILANCGVNGDTARGVLASKRLEWDVFPICPDRVFVMLGMNDVKRELWTSAEPVSDADACARRQVLADYEKNLRKLVEVLSERVRFVVLMTPSPYDQYGEFDGKVLAGCNEPGLVGCAGIVRKVGREAGIPVVELHDPLTTILKRDRKARLCGDDRVHPGTVGHSLIAAHILRACGGSEMEAESLAKGLREDPCAKKAEECTDAVSRYRRVAEYRKVLRSMGGDDRDNAESDVLLDKWVESGRGTSWQKSAVKSAKAYRALRDHAVDLKRSADAVCAELIDEARASGRKVR